ncbi:putative leader peptide [Nakamurella sp. PAMC28650]
MTCSRWQRRHVDLSRVSSSLCCC